MSDRATDSEAAATADWASGSFRQLGSMPNPDGYDLAAFVGSASHMPRPATYDTITAARAASVRALVDAVLDASAASLADPNAGDWCGVKAKAGAAGYQVRRFYDRGSGRYLAYGRDTLTRSQQAYFFVNPDYRRDVALEAPHEPVDAGTAVEAARVFRDLAARVLVINGAARCASPVRSPCDGTTVTCGGFYRLSDPAHHRANAFHAIHMALDARSLRFAQLHKIRSSYANTAVADDGTTNASDPASVSVTFIDALRGLIDSSGSTTLDDRVVACQTPDHTPEINPETGTNGCARANVQARYTHQRADPGDGPINSCTRGSTYGADRRFLHVEQTAATIDGDCADGYCWQRIAGAIKQTWPCTDGTVGCTIGATQPRYTDRSCP